MRQFIFVDWGPFCKCTELLTEYLTLMISSPPQGFVTKGTHLETVGNHTGSEVLRITASAPVHRGVGADGPWLTKGSLSTQGLRSFPSHLKERQSARCARQKTCILSLK